MPLLALSGKIDSNAMLHGLAFFKLFNVEVLSVLWVTPLNAVLVSSNETSNT